MSWDFEVILVVKSKRYLLTGRRVRPSETAISCFPCDCIDCINRLHFYFVFIFVFVFYLFNCQICLSQTNFL